MHVRVSAGDAEYFDAAMRAPLLSGSPRKPAAASSRRQRRGAAGSDQLQRPRRHRRRRARAVGHADLFLLLMLALIARRVGLSGATRGLA